MKRTSLPLQRREFISLLGGTAVAWPLARARSSRASCPSLGDAKMSDANRLLAPMLVAIILAVFMPRSHCPGLI